MTFTTERYLEVAIKSWLEWNLNSRTLESVQKFQPTNLSCHEFNSHTMPNLCRYSNFMFFSVSYFVSAIAFVSLFIRIVVMVIT